MYINKLILNNFKNFTQNEFTFTDINCIVGNNGVGKTNILEAIYYLAYCKSISGCSDSEMILYNQDFFSIKGDFTINDTTNEIFSISLKKGDKKTLKHGKQTYKKLSDHIGKLSCVIISPNDNIYITGRSENRRKFIDITLSQTDVTYLHNLINYNKCLEARNSLLKQIFSPNFDIMQLDIYTERLSAYAEIIQTKRKEFFEEFLPSFTDFYLRIAENNEQITAKYLTFEGNLCDLLQQNYEKEKLYGYTIQGIHRDDILFLLNNHKASHCASQGQQKTFVLALRLAQFDYLKRHKMQTPILLLDDVFDKFDFNRVERILNLVSLNNFKQVFLTDTQIDRVEKIIPQNKKDKSKIIKL